MSAEPESWGIFNVELESAVLDKASKLIQNQNRER
jgi:hypothetical protein